MFKNCQSQVCQVGAQYYGSAELALGVCTSLQMIFPASCKQEGKASKVRLLNVPLKAPNLQRRADSEYISLIQH
jgi:hypothetical protein